MNHSSGWYGVDLDGTLAEYKGWSADGAVGGPIAPMVARVRQWLLEGKDVRIMTARVGPSDLTGPDAADSQRRIIGDWCELHLGRRLPITATKDYQMLELWDDRAVHVIPNTGQVGIPAHLLAGWSCPVCGDPSHTPASQHAGCAS